ncbi:hypothetical protein MC7420_8333 [Coleofasciculus chthonoplastes PCC 7420]|uniref:Uncharacterized protein n=1 Tax=Coleofasciculus chthonoplastes PCC 7420 TaxID=118168 RepID=B4W0Q4_9CYAN|nr:hypothetical protein MC7420_8333 [Coleofasciculus chthonoplastes PCC 7420]
MTKPALQGKQGEINAIKAYPSRIEYQVAFYHVIGERSVKRSYSQERGSESG